MTDKVVGIDGRPVTPVISTNKVSDADVVAEIMDLLDRAKAGEITAFAYAMSLDSETISTGWVGTSGTNILLGSAIAGLNHRFFSSWYTE